MKSFVLFFLVTALLAFGGCKNSSESESSKPSAASDQPSATKKASDTVEEESDEGEEEIDEDEGEDISEDEDSAPADSLPVTEGTVAPGKGSETAPTK